MRPTPFLPALMLMAACTGGGGDDDLDTAVIDTGAPTGTVLDTADPYAFAPSGVWSLTQTIETVNGVATVIDYPVDVGGYEQHVTYDLVEGGTYTVTVDNVAPDGTSSPFTDPETHTFTWDGHRGVVLVQDDRDPVVTLDCIAEGRDPDHMMCDVQLTFVYGTAPYDLPEQTFHLRR